MPTFDPSEPTIHTQTYDPQFYHPTLGYPWCTFTKGSFRCVNGSKCKSRNHRDWTKGDIDQN